jgi:hypothetical protein
METMSNRDPTSTPGPPLAGRNCSQICQFPSLELTTVAAQRGIRIVQMIQKPVTIHDIEISDYIVPLSDVYIALNKFEREALL